jgi:hypothetical protein
MTLEIARHWRLRLQRYGLVGEVCPSCNGKIFPPRDVCPHCAEAAGPAFQFSGKGEVFSFSTVHNAPEGYEGNVPYVVALVRLQEGPLITAQLTDIDADEVEIGMPLEMVTRKLVEQGEEGLIQYGYKFRPVLTI